jgi:hypothetical protein
MKSTTDAPASAVHQPRDIPAWVDRDVYPFTSRFLDLPRVRLHHVDEGAGHPVLFMHGTPTWSFGSGISCARWRRACGAWRPI